MIFARSLVAFQSTFLKGTIIRGSFTRLQWGEQNLDDDNKRFVSTNADADGSDKSNVESSDGKFTFSFDKKTKPPPKASRSSNNGGRDRNFERNFERNNNNNNNININNNNNNNSNRGGRERNFERGGNNNNNNNNNFDRGGRSNDNDPSNNNKSLREIYNNNGKQLNLREIQNLDLHHLYGIAPVANALKSDKRSMSFNQTDPEWDAKPPYARPGIRLLLQSESETNSRRTSTKINQVSEPCDRRV